MKGRTKRNFHDELFHELEYGVDLANPFVHLETGLYFEQVKRYIEIFGEDNVKIIIFEELAENSKKIMQEILEFLKINHPLDNFKGEIHYPHRTVRGPIARQLIDSKIARKIAKKVLSTNSRLYLKEEILKTKSKPKIPTKDVDTLRKYYHDDVKKIQKLLSRKLPWKNFDI